MRAKGARENQSRIRRTLRTRSHLKRPVDNGRMRLSVFRSHQHIYAQIINDNEGHTLAQANSKGLKLSGNKTEQAKAVGKALAEQALAQGVKMVVFDRGPYKYHGRIKALADAAREGGLVF
ncbi:MAG: 50S ribosomal protein L18 [Deinococcales bacterium]